MKIQYSHIIKHLSLTVAMVAFCVLCTSLPFLPGRYIDGVATLSLVAQILGAASFLIVPTGLIWFVLMLRRKHTEKKRHVLPLYMIIVPGVTLSLQLVLATPMTERSRSMAIKNSAKIIRDIELFRTENGEYPTSLLAVWPDYSPGVIGVPQYRYERHGDAYNIVFEQPRFLLDDLGAREFVVYNPRDEQAITSHAMWRLSHPELQGWFAAHDAGALHWKFFLFD